MKINIGLNTCSTTSTIRVMQIKTTRILHTHQHGWYFVFFGCAGSSLQPQRTSLAAEQGLQSLQAQRLQDTQALQLWCSRLLSLRSWTVQLQSTGSVSTAHGDYSYGVQVQLPHNMWDLNSQTRTEPMSPAMEGGFLTTSSLGKFPQGWLSIQEDRQVQARMWRN